MYSSAIRIAAFFLLVDTIKFFGLSVGNQAIKSAFPRLIYTKPETAPQMKNPMNAIHSRTHRIDPGLQPIPIVQQQC
jgi:hypothetical protein